MEPSKRPGTFRYALIGAALIVAAGLAIGVMQHVQITQNLNAINERNNVILARAFANIVWPGVSDFVRAAHTLSIDELKAHPKVRETHVRAQEIAKDVPLLKIKIFDLSGLTVFSTDPSQIGDQKAKYPGFVAARNGKVESILETRETFTAFEQEIRDLRVLSSYVPIFGDSGEIEGVFEIYMDVTEPATEARNSAMLQLAVIGIVFLLLYEMGFTLVRHRDKTIAEIHAEHIKLTEKAVAAEESSRTKSALLANMSHELRTPLNAVIGFAETMRLQPFGPIGSAKYLTYLDDIWMSGRHLLDIVDNVLEMARIDNGSATPQISGVEISEIIASATRQIDSNTVEPRAPILVHNLRHPLTVLVDERRMRKVLVQLLANARKFTPPHGSIEISARRNRDGGVDITVTDTGIGMAPEDTAIALLPFSKMDRPYEHSSEGARLGLPLSKMLMELHGGTLTMESILGKGTSVTVSLPFRCVVTEIDPPISTRYQI